MIKKLWLTKDSIYGYSLFKNKPHYIIENALWGDSYELMKLTNKMVYEILKLKNPLKEGEKGIVKIELEINTKNLKTKKGRKYNLWVCFDRDYNLINLKRPKYRDFCCFNCRLDYWELGIYGIKWISNDTLKKWFNLTPLPFNRNKGKKRITVKINTKFK